jgi:hypothetical protein
MKMGLVSAALLLASMPVFAQTMGDPGAPGGPGGGHHFMGRGFGPAEGGFGLMRAPITNAPYTATFTSTATEKLQDDTVLTHTITRVATRDALGRTRDEVTLPARSNGDGEPHTMITIVDPVTHTITQLHADRKVAVVHQMPSPHARDRWDGADRRGSIRRGPGGPPTESASANAPGDGMRGFHHRREDNVATTDLGSKTMDGVTATGRRMTRTIPLESAGKTIVATHEVWFSPDLQIELSRSDVDPFRGTHTVVATSLSKAVPDPALFQVPQGYTVEQAPQHAGRRGAGRDGQMPAPPPGV